MRKNICCWQGIRRSGQTAYPRLGGLRRCAAAQVVGGWLCVVLLVGLLRRCGRCRLLRLLLRRILAVLLLVRLRSRLLLLLLLLLLGAVAGLAGSRRLVCEGRLAGARSLVAA